MHQAVRTATADTGRNHDGADQKGYRQHNTKIVGIIVLKEYKDYLFHIGQSCIGTLIGLREVKLCY